MAVGGRVVKVLRLPPAPSLRTVTNWREIAQQHNLARLVLAQTPRFCPPAMSAPDATKPKISFSFGGAKKAGAVPSTTTTTAGFSLPKPKTAPAVKPPKAFSLAADEDEPAPQEAESSTSGRSWGKPKVDPKKLVHQAVKPSRADRERQEVALGLDQKAFAYDEVWDSMKDAEKVAKQRREDESSDRKVRWHDPAALDLGAAPPGLPRRYRVVN
jgi:hypothetical protein